MASMQENKAKTQHLPVCIHNLYRQVNLNHLKFLARKPSSWSNYVKDAIVYVATILLIKQIF